VNQRGVYGIISRPQRRQNLYYCWSKDFLEAGKKRLAGDTARTATSDEVKDLRREAGPHAASPFPLGGWTLLIQFTPQIGIS
jgi:hypothetical protein